MGLWPRCEAICGVIADHLDEVFQLTLTAPTTAEGI